MTSAWNYNRLAALMQEFLKSHSAASMTAHQDVTALQHLNRQMDAIVEEWGAVREMKEVDGIVEEWGGGVLWEKWEEREQ